MEDDIFSMATEPILNASDPGIYEDETQPIIGAFDDSPPLYPLKQKGRVSSDASCDDLTQKLDFVEKENCLQVHQSNGTTTGEAIDSDSDTIPASPVFDIHEDVSFEKDLPRDTCDPNLPPSKCMEARNSASSSFTDSKYLHQEEEEDLDYPTQPLSKFQKAALGVEQDDSMDAPTQRLPRDKSFDPTADDVTMDEPTQLLPDCTKHNTLIGCKPSCSLPAQHHPDTIINEPSMDAPTQKLSTITVYAAETGGNSMDAPTQPLLAGRKALTLSDHEDSMDAPTQLLVLRSKKDFIASDNENSMDAPTQPLRISKPQLSINISRSVQRHYCGSEDRPSSPTLDLGLASTGVESDEVTSPTDATENDETQPVDFDPQAFLVPNQTKSSDCISPMPFRGEAFKRINAVSASSTPYQKKERVGNKADGQPNNDKVSAPFLPPVSPSEKREEDSDAETLPGTPGLDLGTPSSDFVPCSQEEDAEHSSPVRRSLVLKSLQKTDEDEVDSAECEEPATSPILSPKNSFKQRQLMENKENQPMVKTACDASLSRHQSVSSHRDDTECESPVFDFDDSSEAIVDETQAASPTSFDVQDSPPIIAETPFIGSGPSPRKKRKIIRRSGYCINNSTFLQQSTASEDTVTDKTEEYVPVEKPKPPQLSNLESELEESDYELTFASRHSSASSQTTSEEPFVGFTNDDKEQISGDLKLMRKVIDADEQELSEERRKRLSTASRRSVRSLGNSDPYDMGSSSAKSIRKTRSSSSSDSSLSMSSAVDMDIESSDDELPSAVAGKRRTVSSTPSTTNVTVDMEIVSPFDAGDQVADTSKHSLRSCRSRRRSDVPIPDSTHPTSAAQSVKKVPEPAMAKEAPKSIRKSTSKRFSGVMETISHPSMPSAELRVGLERMETEASKQEAEKKKPSLDADKVGRINVKAVSNQSKITSTAIQSTEAQTSDDVRLGGQTRVLRNVTRKNSGEATNGHHKQTAQKISNLGDIAEQPLPSMTHPEEETVAKKAKGGRSRKASVTRTQPRYPQSSDTSVNCEAIVPPVLKTGENLDKQQELPRKRKGARPRASKKDGSSTVDESSDETEGAQPAVASVEPSTRAERNDEAMFHQPKLPVRRGRRRRVGSDASSISNASVRTDVESSDEASNREPSRDSVSTAESSSDESKSRKTRTSKQTRATASKTNTSMLNASHQASTPNHPVKRGRGRAKKDALNDSVSSTSGVGQARGASRVNGLNASVNSPVVEVTRRRKRALAGQVRVLFTVVDDDEDREIIASLGGKVVAHPKDCSVLVTDRIRRTVKFLCCVGRGVPIVGLDWLEKCKASGKFLDPWLHLLRDKEGEAKFNFKLADTLQVSCETPLLSGVTLHATAGVKPPPAEMQEIVLACGGIYAEDSEDMSGERKFVITCIEDKKIWSYLRRRKVKLIDKEAILTGVLQQSFEPEKFTLN